MPMLVVVVHLLILLTEELLIDFCELIGTHSGINMAEAVWLTMVLYGLEGQVGDPPNRSSLCTEYFLLCRFWLLTLTMPPIMILLWMSLGG